jgi:hypothetical protein
MFILSQRPRCRLPLTKMNERDGWPSNVHTSGRFLCAPCRDEAVLQDLLGLDHHFLSRVAQMTDDEVTVRFRQCPTAFHCVHEVSGGGTHLRGYFIILPLTAACAAAIRRGDVTAGRQIHPSDLVQSDQTIESVYLSVVCAVGARARSALIASAIEVIRSLHSDRGTRYLFARAATAAGAHMLTRLTQHRFALDKAIHEIDVSHYFTVQ